MILLDASLFNNLDEGIEQYVIYASHLDITNPNKFLISTPARALLAFYRYWEEYSSLECTKQDMCKLTCNIKTIVKH